MNNLPRMGAERDYMNCMEVWGGNGTRSNHLTRPGLDVWISSHSNGCAESGGSDLHLLSSCASGRITRMLLADVCSCGPLFQEISAELRDLMKRNVNVVQQGRFVRHMNRRLACLSERGGFASTLISTYFAPTRSYSLCNAGHPPPLLFRSRSREWSVLRQVAADLSRAAVPDGVVDFSEYQQLTTKMDVGDMVLSYSNILTECRDTRGDIVGLDGLLAPRSAA